MNKFFSLLILACCIVLAGCSDDDNTTEGQTLYVVDADVMFDALGGEGKINVFSTVGSFSAVSSHPEWCRTVVSGNTVTVTVDPSEDMLSRNASIRISSGDRYTSVIVNQEGAVINFGGTMTIDRTPIAPTEMVIDATTSDYTVEVPSQYSGWLSVQLVDGVLTVTAEPNGIVPRKGQILLTRGNGGVYTMNVSQKGGTKAEIYSTLLDTNWTATYKTTSTAPTWSTKTVSLSQKSAPNSFTTNLYSATLLMSLDFDGEYLTLSTPQYAGMNSGYYTYWCPVYGTSISFGSAIAMKAAVSVNSSNQYELQFVDAGNFPGNVEGLQLAGFTSNSPSGSYYAGGFGTYWYLKLTKPIT